jgi:hypothetical protein
VKYGLSPGYFEGYLRKGVDCFFGVTVDKEKLLQDEQSPELFEKWSKLRALY